MKVCKHLFTDSDPHNKNAEDRIIKNQKQYEIILNVNVMTFTHRGIVLCVWIARVCCKDTTYKTDMAKDDLPVI